MKKILLPKIAMGAWAWGNDGTFGTSLSSDKLKPVFDTAMANGFCLWDTAYAYGMGTSEKVLGSFLKNYKREDYLISDKLTPQCMDGTSADKMLNMQCGLLGIENVDIYWIHNPVNAPFYIEEVARLFEGKKDIPLIGVSNHNLAEIQQAQMLLEAHGLKLSCVQNHYSLLNRSSEKSGILDYCKQNGITFFSYMVLEQGALSGSYDSTHPFPEGSDRANAYNGILQDIEKLVSAMHTIADNKNASVAQIATAWAIAKGTLPIIGVTKVKHIEDAVKSTEIQLTATEIDIMELIASCIEVNVIRYWEKEMK